MKKIITNDLLQSFIQHLLHEERSQGTLQKYRRDLHAFVSWLNGRPLSKEAVIQWRDALLSEGYQPVTINSMLAALNGLFRFLGWHEFRVHFLKIQRRVFRDQAKVLSPSEYRALLDTAQSRGQERLALLMETIYATGIRVSEVKYLTVETLCKGTVQIALKGKIRTVLLPDKLCRKLLKYAKKQRITSGEIFVTKSGNSLSRRQIWAEMKQLCKYAGVEASKVFPHNLRHLFAEAFYRVYKDIARLADILGHSSIETTRIYLLSTGEEHQKKLDRLGLVS